MKYILFFSALALMVSACTPNPIGYSYKCSVYKITNGDTVEQWGTQFDDMDLTAQEMSDSLNKSNPHPHIVFTKCK